MGSVVKTLKGPKNSAPGQYLGYALQPVRLCSHLLRAPDGSTVSLEHLDDISSTKPNGHLLLEQCKSSLRGNPLADKSVEMWKAFATWAALAKAGKINSAKTRFQIYVTPENTGPVAERLHAASTKQAISPILTELKTWIKPSTAGKGCNPHLSAFLSAGDALCLEIIRNFQIVREQDPLEGVREILRAFIPEGSLEDFCKAAIGHAKEEADDLIRGGKTATIDAKMFRKKFRAFVSKHSLAGLLNSTTDKPDDAVVKGVVSSSPVFIRQLQLVKIGDDALIEAASDFLQTNADKTNWAADGEIVADSFDEFDNGLKKRFKLARDEFEDTQKSEPPELRGRSTYRKCVGWEAKLEGREVPRYFVPGSYNILADTRQIGWHPQYVSLLGEE